MGVFRSSEEKNMRVEFRYGKKIRQLREERSWTQEQLAAIAGVESRTIQRVEKDQTKNQETLLAIAAAFDVGLDAIRNKWRVAESRLLRTWLVATYSQFVHVQEAHPWQMSYRSVIAPLTEERQTQTDELLSQIFADREYIEPYETDLWDCYIRCIKEPIQSLFEMGLVIFILDERRDLLLPSIGDLKPQSDYMDCRVQHTMIVPRHGCFRLDATEPLHLFNDSCSVAGESLFRAAKHHDIGMPVHVYSNALWAAMQPGSEDAVRWCDACFPPLSGGARITFEYIEKVTGWTRAQLHTLCDAVTGQPFLEGLA
jgi:transcriptional regulator with XRE-family HTH domain